MRIRTVIGIAIAGGTAAVAAGLGGAAALAAGADSTEPAGLILVENAPAVTQQDTGTGAAAQGDCPEKAGAAEAPAPETL